MYKRFVTFQLFALFLNNVASAESAATTGSAYRATFQSVTLLSSDGTTLSQPSRPHQVLSQSVTRVDTTPGAPPPDQGAAARIQHIQVQEQGIPPNPADFLPNIDITGSSESITRGGVSMPTRPELLKYKPAELTVPDVTQTTLSNGLRLYSYESHDLPYVHYSLILNAGKQFDPADKIGLAEITANTLRSGGSTTRSGDEIDRALEQIGSDLSIAADREFVRISMFALSEKKEEALKILVDLLLNPAFDEKKFAQQKDRLIEEIRRENDEPSEISRREFRKIIYGPEHPISRTPRPQHVAAITRDDVKAFYEKFYRPSNGFAGVAGDISAADAEKLLNDHLAAWKKPPLEVPAVPAVDTARDAKAGVFLLNRETAQSQIRMGHLGVPRRSPEQYALNVLNGIYGTGGFSSRLMNEVRTRKGYVYGVGGAVSSDNPLGMFAAAASSKSKSTAAAISSMVEVTTGLLSGDISQGEIDIAKKDAVYSFMVNFDTPREIVWQHMYYDFIGYPADYLKTFVPRIQAVTREELIAAARKYIHADRLKIFVVGNAQDFDRPLEGFGAVQKVELPEDAKPAEGSTAGTAE